MKNTLSLQELFNNRIFRVPDYQRGYAWEGQQVGEFLDDLALLRSTGRHYTGTIVLYQTPSATEKTDNEGISYAQADVVDGQQRLTTIVLLLNEISRALSSHEGSGDLARGIRKNYVEGMNDDDLPLYKLSLNKDIDGFFKSNVLADTPGVAGPPIASARRLLLAKRQIADHLRTAGGDAAGQVKWLRNLQRAVTTRLHFNLYEVEHTAEVGVIFEVMNDRGKQLTDLEKVKNYLLYVISTLDVEPDSKDQLTTSVNETWADILKELMAAGLGAPSDEDQFLRAHWLMQYDPQSRNWKGSKSIKGRFDLRLYRDRPAQLANELHEYMRTLRDACVCYCDAQRPDRDSAFGSFSFAPALRRDVRFWNSKLVRIGVTATFLPLLMAVRKRWPSDPQKYLDIVRLCEVLAFRFYQVARYYSSFGRSNMFYLANEVTQGADFEAVIRKIERIYSDRDASRRFDEFTDESAPTDWYGRGALRYLLYEYEQYLASAKGASPKVNWTDIKGADRRDTIEHVLPQSIEDRPYWQERFDADTHGEYVHDIGNLTLTKHNSFYGNKPFPEKQGAIGANTPCYAVSPLFQEQELAQYGEWTVESIDTRRAKLLMWAKERWCVDFTGLDAAEPEIDGDDELDDSGEK